MMLSIPKYHSWLKFKEWADEYGPIYQLNIAGSTHVVVASDEIANDLCRERGTLYSDRPQLPMAAKLLSDNLRPLLLPYGPAWRAFRRFTHSVAMPSVVSDYAPVQESEALRLVHDLIQDPSQYQSLIERYAASIIMRLNYGITLDTGKEPVLKRIIAVNHNLERIASPGAYLVDTFPSLLHLPNWLAPFKREGARLHAEEYSLFSSLVHDVAERARNNDPAVTNTFTKQWLDTAPKYQPHLTDPLAHYVLGTIFEAASGTTAAALQSFLLAMVLHPSKFTLLADELSHVIPPTRLPTLNDLPSLPYLRATIKETLRWRPVTAGGLPHQLTARADTYRGYHIPRNATIHPVQWAIHRDTTLYPSPEEFLPERWLEPAYPTYKEPLETYPNLQNFSSFGFGRRICPGQHIAERSLYIAVAIIAWGCEVKERAGRRPPEYDYTKGFNAQPNRFEFELRGREGRVEVLAREMERVWGKAGEEGVGG